MVFHATRLASRLQLLYWRCTRKPLLPMETIAHRDAAKELENAKCKKAAFSIQANNDFDGSLEVDAPIPGRVISYKAKDGLEIMDKYNDEWWIGRKDGEIGFIPSPTKLKSLRIKAQN